MTTHPSRRDVLGLGLALAAALPAAPLAALGTEAGRALVESLVADVNATIASGVPEAEMLRQFEQIFDRHADVPTIARYSLGSAARGLPPEQLARYTAAFRSYIARKYGGRFREFIGGAVEVVEAREVPNGIEVECTAIFVGRDPFRVDFWVSDASGAVKFFNIIIEGVNMLLSERTEILAMLDQRGGDIDRLVADLPRG